MQICCTKDLQQELGIKAEAGFEENDLFCWSTHIITINRKKAVVAVNDSNRFGFVLFGLKAKEFKNLKEHLLQGIKKCLADEKIKEEVIEEYIKAASDIAFARTRGPKYVSRLNKAVEMVKAFSDRIEPEKVYQAEVARLINDDFIKTDKQADYEHPHDLLISDMEEFAVGNIISCKAVNLRIKLNLGRRDAWRRIITPIDITFKELHYIIQTAFNWKDRQLYNFNVFDKSGRCLATLISRHEETYDTYTKGELLLDEEVRLSEYDDKNIKIVYCYDYGADWKHEIIIDNINMDYDKNYPVCLMGEGNTPPEDVGGIFGYVEFLKIISNPKHEKYNDTYNWLQSQGYREFDIDIINKRLKNILRFPVVF
ncbi:hypothetical protein HMPREF1982_01839 [Clostridiales bacterium oral taxon 876 str. F0540]|nr:hypothetical protein HMPREF1982_01839 [Clostridiales bacterium oral taxon 876 str. F0540]